MRTQTQQRKANTRVFALTQQEADTSDDVVAGKIYINSLPPYVLFDYGATHSFISQKFSKSLGRLPNHLYEGYRVGTSRGKILFSDLIY